MIKTVLLSSVFAVPAFINVSTTDAGDFKIEKRHVTFEKHTKIVNNHPVVFMKVSQVKKPPTKKDIKRYIHNASIKYKVDEKLINAIVNAESTYRTEALSGKGALGLMQLMPATAERFGVLDRSNAKQNIEGGVRFLKYLLDTFGDTRLAVAGYNAGEHAIMRHNYKIPPYPETRNYVNIVMNEYKKG
jgi:soluble lytic murein transglycosylase-like protein